MQKRKPRARSTRRSAAKYAKVTVSLPHKDLLKIEELSKKLNISRSGLMLCAVRHWFDEVKKQSQIADYVKGYELQPENEAALKVMEAVQSQSLDEEDW
jgi:hypothetical protein